MEKKEIFISASKKNSDVSDRFYKYLSYVQECSLLYYRDGELLKVGSNFWKEINCGINASGFFIAFLSSDYFLSSNCLSELKRALLLEEYGYLKIIPILIDDFKYQGNNKRIKQLFASKQYTRLKSEALSRGEVLKQILETLGFNDSIERVEKLSEQFSRIPYWAIDSVIKFQSSEFVKKLKFSSEITLGEALKIVSDAHYWESCGIASINEKGDFVSKGATTDLLTNAKARSFSFLEGKIDLKKPLSRIEFAEFLLLECDVFVDEEKNRKIQDISENEPNYKFAKEIISTGLLKLDENGNFNPNSTIKVYEFLYVFDRTRILLGAPMPTDNELFLTNRNISEKEGKSAISIEVGTDLGEDKMVHYIGFDLEKAPQIQTIKINNIIVGFELINYKERYYVKLKKPWLIIPNRTALFEIKSDSKIETPLTVHKKKAKFWKSLFKKFAKRRRKQIQRMPHAFCLLPPKKDDKK